MKKISLSLLLICCGASFSTYYSHEAIAQEKDPPEVVLGERLFLETRFAQYFAEHSGHNISEELQVPDPTLNATVTTNGGLPSPFAQASMNCRACHLVDEHRKEAEGGMRTYADFARRSPIPPREDGRVETLRNSPPLVNASLPSPHKLLLHYDGEFARKKDLVKAGFTGRNFGWLPHEFDKALHHIAKVLREDDGKGTLAKEFGGFSYRTLFEGKDPSIPAEYRIAPKYRISFATASDEEILDAVAIVVAEYFGTLEFARNEKGEYVGSPYDRFLKKNNLPRKPASGESDAGYTKRLGDLILSLKSPRFVTKNEGSFTTHKQPFVFGAKELQGFKIFLAREVSSTGTSQSGGLGQSGGIGNCASCHPAPHFTDFKLHNIGVSQEEYELVHGKGTYFKVHVPTYGEREQTPVEFFAANKLFLEGKGQFLSSASSERLGATDLGAWNVLFNPSFRAPQRRLKKLFCEKKRCARPRMLRNAFAAFKTPGLRDLGHSAPYLHNGSKDTLEDVMIFYREVGMSARKGELRFADKELRRIRLNGDDKEALSAFLRSLNEDYE